MTTHSLPAAPETGRRRLRPDATDRISRCPRIPPAAGAAVALLAAMFAGCNDEGPYGGAEAETGNGDDRPPLVRVEPVDVRSVQHELETTAYLEAERHVTVLPEVAGRVLEVLVDEGAAVTAGQVLAKLDAREAEALRRQAAVRLRDAEVRAELAALEVEASQRRVAQAGIDRDKAKAELERQQNMDPSLVAKKTLDEAGFAFESAEQSLLVAEFNERKAGLDESAAKIAIEEMQARLDEFDIKLEDHTVRAPFDGVVVERHVKGGETVGAATELFVVADTKNLISYLTRPQIQLPLVHGAREVRFTADAYGGREFVAGVDLISPVVDQATGHFKIRIRVRDAGRELLRPGMFIRARILTEDARQALMVPKAALLTDGDKTVVFAVREGQAHRVVLDPGLELQDWIECLNRGDGGLRDDDAVIVRGHEDLDDQTVVDVQRGG